MINEKSSSKQIDTIIRKLGDWRGEKLTQLRALIRQADSDVIEEVNWKKPSNPDGMICTGETYKNHLRLTFTKGASLKDPEGLFNTNRAIVIHEDDKINKDAFKNLIRAAVALNHNGKNKPKSSKD
jgi:hypothetical protein